MPRFFFVCLIFFCAAASGSSASLAGKSCTFKLVDVDGRTLTASDHVVSVLVLTSRRDADKARLVGNRIPARCLGVPGSRMITVVRFPPTRNRAYRYMLTSLMRRRLNQEAVDLQRRYAAKGLARDARQDMYGVADFDGQTALQFGLPAGSLNFRVLVISANGTVLRDWNDVPSAEELSNVLP
jgi:hypothetical protein